MTAPKQDADFELLNARRIRDLTGLSERFVLDLLYNRRLPVVKLGKFVYVRRVDLAAWIEANTKPAKGPRP